MSLINAEIPVPGSLMANALCAIDLELAPDLSEREGEAFPERVQRAAAEIDAHYLFDMPLDDPRSPFCHVAAVRLSGPAGTGSIAFVLAERDDPSAFRIGTREDVGEQLYGYALAHARILERMSIKPSIASA